MTQVLVLVLALLIGVIAGLRAMTAPAVVAWGAMLGWIDVDGQVVGVGGASDHRHRADHPADRRTDHRSAAEDAQPQGAAAVHRPADQRRLRRRGHRQRVLPHLQRAGAGVIGAVLGTLGGAAAPRPAGRGQQRQGPPGAFIEDVIAVGGGFLVAFLVSLV